MSTTCQEKFRFSTMETVRRSPMPFSKGKSWAGGKRERMYCERCRREITECEILTVIKNTADSDIRRHVRRKGMRRHSWQRRGGLPVIRWSAIPVQSGRIYPPFPRKRKILQAHRVLQDSHNGWCPERDSNPHTHGITDFKSVASAISPSGQFFS